MTRRFYSFKWLGILGPLLVAVLFLYAAYFRLPSFFLVPSSDAPAILSVVLLLVLAGLLSAFLSRLYGAGARERDQLKSLYEAGMAVSSKLDLAQALNTVTERGRRLLNVDASALCLWDDEKRRLLAGSQSGPAEAFEFQAGHGRVPMPAFSQVDTARQDSNCLACAMLSARYRRTLVKIPVRLGDQVIGCLCVSSARSRQFRDGEVALLAGLADLAAIAIRNARAYEAAGNKAITVERERLAREMHDTLAQVLGFVNTKSQALRVMLDDGDVPGACEQVDQLAALSQELYADVREVILGLRTALSPDQDLFAALSAYVEAFCRQSGIDTSLQIESGAGEMTFAPGVELQLIRIVQESLTNVRKHAHARHAVVRFGVLDGHAEMRIEDDGSGFDPRHIARGDWPHFGLQTMRERAESVGGAFAVMSKPDAGTQIVVQIPLGCSGGRRDALVDCR